MTSELKKIGQELKKHPFSMKSFLFKYSDKIDQIKTGIFHLKTSNTVVYTNRNMKLTVQLKITTFTKVSI